MKILVADEHALFRDYMASYITNLKKESVVLQVSDFPQAVKILEKEPDVNMIILDLDMPDMRRAQSIEKLKNILPNLQVVVISACEDIEQIKKIISMDIMGYIPRRFDLEMLKNALNTVLSGEKYVPKALEDVSGETSDKFAVKTLTNRQSQVLDLIAQGKSNKQIAYEMGVSEATVKLHINALLRSLKVNNRTQAVITAQKIGLI